MNICVISAEFVIYDYEATRHCDLMQFTKSLKSQLLVFGKLFTRIPKNQNWFFSRSTCLDELWCFESAYMVFQFQTHVAFPFVNFVSQLRLVFG